MEKNAVIILMIFSLTLPAQKQDTLRPRKFSWGLTFSPDFCYRILKYRSSAQWIEDRRNAAEQPKLGFTFGINMNRLINERINIDAGFLFSDKGEKTRWMDLTWMEGGDFPVKSRTIFHYQYLDIPLKINYCVLRKKIRLFISAGISSNFFIRQRTVLEMEYEGGRRTKSINNEQEVYSDVNFAFIFGFGISYDLTKRITIKLEPVYRQSICPVLVNMPDKEYLYSAGLTMSIYLRLKSKRK